MRGCGRYPVPDMALFELETTHLWIQGLHNQQDHNNRCQSTDEPFFAVFWVPVWMMMRFETCVASLCVFLFC